MQLAKELEAVLCMLHKCSGMLSIRRRPQNSRNPQCPDNPLWGWWNEMGIGWGLCLIFLVNAFIFTGLG